MSPSTPIPSNTYSIGFDGLQTIVPINTFPPEPTQTRIFSPTFSPQDGARVFHEWVWGNNECELPCWAGITPGKTTWQESMNIMETMTGYLSLDSYLNVECAFGPCNEIRWALYENFYATGYVYSKLPENKIHLLYIEIDNSNEADNLNLISLQEMLQIYGRPSTVLLSAETDLPGGDAYLILVLVYPENRFIVTFTSFAEINNEMMIVCNPSNIQTLVVVDNKEQLMSVDAIANAEETKNLHVDVWHKPVEDAMGMSIDTFYETYRDSDSCINTPVNIWQP